MQGNNLFQETEMSEIKISFLTFHCNWYACMCIVQLFTQINTTTIKYQEGYKEELSTCFYLDTILIRTSVSVLSETFVIIIVNNQ